MITHKRCFPVYIVHSLSCHVVGEQEVLGDAVLEAPAGQEGENVVTHRPSIDHMIEQLQREQDQRMAASGETPLGSPPPNLGSPRGVSRSNSGTA